MPTRLSPLIALIASLALATTAPAQVRGTAVYVGPVPPAKVVGPPVGGAPAVQDDRILVGKNNGLKNVVVYVKDGAKLGGAVPDKPAVLDTPGNVFAPRVLPVMVGQELRLRAGGNMLHVPASLPRKNPPFAVTLNQQGQTEKVNAAVAPEAYRVKCRVHPWMTAWVVVLDHPFFATTDENGAFEIPNLKPGKYTLATWHEQAAPQEAFIEVGPDGKLAKPVEFTFHAEK